MRDHLINTPNLLINPSDNLFIPAFFGDDCNNGERVSYTIIENGKLFNLFLRRGEFFNLLFQLFFLSGKFFKYDCKFLVLLLSLTDRSASA
ncbi:hypothetical protein [Methanospirillum hungatei]|uniref:hypothetical protein n=1 Tax=Methanospirillum hungatei TaxID=2203 RepID=UPI00005E1735|nr:hypothetical protein [Methanospirillum hungatei]MBP7035144.1 hypothetical protein [Methanospirillum sp.]MBP9008018.1 hypothetical protein [Methanospirillum sp.]MCA1915485.1 hypothetical protein [Methanospirillum hungatei]HOW06156.1 hypothetical protein [Methanospirillum hungatei]